MRAICSGLLAALAVALVVAAPAAGAGGPRTDAVTPVFPGVELRELTVPLDDGKTTVARVVRFDPEDPLLELRPVLSRGAIPGLETVPDLVARRQDEGALLAVNGGFWFNSPVGEPNGLFVADGRLVSEAQSQGGIPRGALGWSDAGDLLGHRVDSELSIRIGVEEYELTALNRFFRDDPPFPDDPDAAIYLYTPEFGASVTAQPIVLEKAEDDEQQPGDGGDDDGGSDEGAADAGAASADGGDPASQVHGMQGATVEQGPGPQASAADREAAADEDAERETLALAAFEVADLRPVPHGTATGVVTNRHPDGGTITIPPEGSVLVAHGAAAEALADTPPGTPVTVTADLEPDRGTGDDWAELTEALAAGPLIVREGLRTNPYNWEREGFAASHTDVRHPRTAVAVDGDGNVLLVTVDGRQPETSVGMTMHELSHFLRQLGARTGLSLDGGGSSQLAVDGLLVNAACCDRPLRPVATALTVFHRYDFPSTERLAGAGREETAVAVSRAAHPAGAEHVVLAAGANFPDALAGGPLARALDAPLLLAGRDSLHPATHAELDRLRPQRVTLLGGEAAISEEVADTLAEDFTVRRIAGRERTETATAIAAELGVTDGQVFLAVSGGFADALSAAAPAAMLGAPVLLTRPDALPPATRAVLETDRAQEVIVVGGEAAVGPEIVDELEALGLEVTRLGGRTRYATAAAVNTWAEAAVPQGTGEPLDLDEVVVANGARFPDALAGGPLAAARRQLLTLVPGVDVRRSDAAATYLDDRAERGLDRVTLVGGYAVLSSHQQWQLDQLTLR